MEKRKQRIVSIIIGLVLASLLIYIGVRILQQRSSRASIPESFTVERIDTDTCRPTLITRTDEPVLLRYGESAPTFYFRFEATDIEEQPDGTFQQQADVNNVGSGQITFLIEGQEDAQAMCDVSTNAAAEKDTKADADPLLDGGVISQAPEPTAAPEPTLALEEPTPTDAPAKSGLPKATADEYFAKSGNEDADFIDCFNEFKDDNYGVVQVCNEAWRDAE